MKFSVEYRCHVFFPGPQLCPKSVDVLLAKKSGRLQFKLLFQCLTLPLLIGQVKNWTAFEWVIVVMKIWNHWCVITVQLCLKSSTIWPNVIRRVFRPLWVVHMKWPCIQASRCDSPSHHYHPAHGRSLCCRHAHICTDFHFLPFKRYIATSLPYSLPAPDSRNLSRALD